LPQAERIVSESRALSSENPLTDAMLALIDFYQGEASSALATMERLSTEHPGNEFIQELHTKIREGVRAYPTIEIIKLTNI